MGGEFEVLAVVNGGKLEETALHDYFSWCALPQERERFRPESSLLEYIRWLRDCYFVEVGHEHPTGTPRDALVVEFAGWRPEPNRRKGPSEPLFGPAHFSPRIVTGDDYYTPEDLLDMVRSAFGGTIDLDPASHAVANQRVRATTFFQRTDDGLSRQWFGRVWLNPPFSDWPHWADKALEELESGRVKRLLALASAPTLTAAYMSPLLRRCDLMVILTGRVEFWGPQVDNGNGAGPSSGHVLLYCGPEPGDVARVFSRVAVPFLSVCDEPEAATAAIS